MAYIATKIKNNKKNKNFALILLILILTFVSGFRSYNVGIDTMGYVQTTFIPLIYGQFSLAYGEIGFKALSKLILILTNNNIQCVIFILSLIINSLIILRIWDFRITINFPFAIFIYFSSFYAMSMNIVPQFISIAIIFYGTRYLDKNEYTKYLIYIVVATLFHATAPIGIILLIIRNFFIKDIQRKNRNIYILIMTLMPIMIYFGYKYLMKYTKFSNYIDTYFYSSINQFGFMVLIKLLFLVYIYMFFRKYIKEVNLKFYSQLLFTYFIGVSLLSLGYMFAYMDRIALLFMLYEPIVASQKYRRTTINIIVRFVFIVLAIYTFYAELSGNGNGIMPYVTFLQH